MIVKQEILRLKSLGYSQRKTAKLLGIDRGAVRRFWDNLLNDWIQPQPPWSKKLDWDYIKNELNSTSRKIIYEELKESNILPSYQAFCYYLRTHKIEKLPEITIKIDRSSGASVEVDYSGDSVSILNLATGELYNVELFVGSMSYLGVSGKWRSREKTTDLLCVHLRLSAELVNLY